MRDSELKALAEKATKAMSKAGFSANADYLAYRLTAMDEVPGLLRRIEGLRDELPCEYASSPDHAGKTCIERKVTQPWTCRHCRALKADDEAQLR
jgi:hypothetical protein